jgi:hypothetical protein
LSKYSCREEEEENNGNDKSGSPKPHVRMVTRKMVQNH